MRTVLPILSMLAMLASCSASNDDLAAERKVQAENFFRGVYGCVPTTVDELAGDDIVLSYPIFAKLYTISAFRGREAVIGFAERFCSRWKEAQFTFHESLADGDNVVLVWSFRARFVGGESPGGPVPGEEQAWGSISLFQFDSSGRIVAEIGEESTPGPMARVAGRSLN